MKWLKRILIAVLALVVLCVGGLFLWGLRPSHGHVVAEVSIDRPAPQVFRFLMNDDLLKKWIGGMGELKQVSAPADGGEVGKRFRLAETYKDQRVEMDMTVTRFERNKALSILVASAGDPANGFTETGDYTLTEQNGKTLLRFDVQTKYFGVVPRLFEPIITPAAARKLNEDFQRLKQLAEAEPVVSQRLDSR